MTITAGEGLQWLVGKLQGFALGLVPDEDKLQILTQRMQEDVAEKRRNWQEALRSQVEIEDPEHPDEGKLPALRLKLERREAQGAKAGLEAQGTVTPERAKRLTDRMKQASADIQAVEGEISAMETLLATRKETTALRRSAFVAAKKDLQKLTEVAPTILAQTQALNDAQKEKLAALEATGHGADSQAGALLEQLQQELETAKAGHSAANIIVAEEDDDELDLDAEETREEAETESDERIARWTGKATAPANQSQ
ncbi:MAG: hypothetical protein K1X83_12120 [Oligoflexia bacterium]|nr:hypothetical protein [Oligoflexia bacterium]